MASSEEEARTEAMEKYGIAEADADTLTLEQDEDVLDTWCACVVLESVFFSSSKNPFSVSRLEKRAEAMEKYGLHGADIRLARLVDGRRRA